MKDFRTILTAAALAGLAAGAHAGPTRMKGAEFAAAAKVTLATARRTALKARPGVVTDQELEKERGGSGLRYSFDITSRGRPYEVGIDARTGAVLENVAESGKPD